MPNGSSFFIDNCRIPSVLDHSSLSFLLHCHQYRSYQSTYIHNLNSNNMPAYLNKPDFIRLMASRPPPANRSWVGDFFKDHPKLSQKAASKSIYQDSCIFSSSAIFNTSWCSFAYELGVLSMFLFFYHGHRRRI